MSRIAEKLSMNLLISGVIVMVIVLGGVTTIKLNHKDTLTNKVDSEIDATDNGITNSSVKTDANNEALIVAKSYLVAIFKDLPMTWDVVLSNSFVGENTISTIPYHFIATVNNNKNNTTYEMYFGVSSDMKRIVSDEIDSNTDVCSEVVLKGSKPSDKPMYCTLDNEHATIMYVYFKDFLLKEYLETETKTVENKIGNDKYIVYDYSYLPSEDYFYFYIKETSVPLSRKDAIRTLVTYKINIRKNTYETSRTY